MTMLLYSLKNFDTVWAFGQLSATKKMFLGASILGILSWSLAPTAAAARAYDHHPLVFTVSNFEGIGEWTVPIFPQDYFTKTLNGQDNITKVVDPRITTLREYLESKKSPLAPHAETLLALKNYKFVIGISFAESNFCKHNIRPHNCWGIGGTRPESYADYKEAVIRADALIQKYHDSGRTTPRLMRDRWVGWKNHSWPLAVEQAIAAMDSRGL